MSGTGHRVAVITGASHGIEAGTGGRVPRAGLGGCRQFPGDQAIRRPGRPDRGGDISQPATADRIVIGALERFGRIDALVNNAAIFIGQPFTDHTIDDYQLVVGVNLTGFFLVTQRVIAAMLKSGGLGGCPRVAGGVCGISRGRLPATMLPRPSRAGSASSP